MNTGLKRKQPDNIFADDIGRPPSRDDRLFEVMRTAELRQAAPAGSEVEEHLGLELARASSPWCHQGHSCLGTDGPPRGHLFNGEGPLQMPSQ